MHEYTTSNLFGESERVAIEFAMAAASVPNGVTDELFSRLSEYWSEEEIVEILGVVCMFGIFNRWNDSMATPQEDEAIEVGTRLLGPSDWTIGKHG
jgi:alkylhydroperoxidase family enzyme